MSPVSSSPLTEVGLPKMGMFNDISLYGSVIFPTDGELAGGIIACPLTGVGKEVKTKAQLQMISS